MKPLFLSDPEISRLLSYASVAQTLERVFQDMAHGQAIVFPRHRTDAGKVKISAMGGIWQAQRVAGIKAYTTADGKFSFLVNLFDLEKNQPMAVIEANEITRFRTAALVAMVAEKSALAGSRKLALIGAGVQGQAIAEALAGRFPLEQVCIVDPAMRPLAASAFAERVGIHAQLCTPEAAVREADLVVTASRSKTPVFQGAWLKPGALVAAVGTSLPDGRELDADTLKRAGRVIVEWKPQSLVEAGEIVLGRAEGSLDSDKIVDLGETCRGDQAWRAKADEIVVFKSVGVGLADVATAWLAATHAADALAQPARRSA